MAKIKGAIVVDTERCKGCNLCVVACPLDVIALNKEVNMKGYNYAWQVKEDTCNGCSSCATVCPDGCVGNACRTETVGNNRHGSTPGGK